MLHCDQQTKNCIVVLQARELRLHVIPYTGRLHLMNTHVPCVEFQFGTLLIFRTKSLLSELKKYITKQQWPLSIFVSMTIIPSLSFIYLLI